MKNQLFGINYKTVYLVLLHNYVYVIEKHKTVRNNISYVQVPSAEASLTVPIINIFQIGSLYMYKRIKYNIIGVFFFYTYLQYKTPIRI